MALDTNRASSAERTFPVQVRRKCGHDDTIYIQWPFDYAQRIAEQELCFHCSAPRHPNPRRKVGSRVPLWWG